jgi:hypothetical protein
MACTVSLRVSSGATLAQPRLQTLDGARTMEEVGARDADPTGMRTWASFRVSGDRLDPDAVTEQLHLAPDLARAKGQRWSYPNSSKERTQPTSVWILKSTPHVNASELENHLVFLLDAIEPHRAALAAVLEEYGAEADFYCLWQTHDGSGGLSITPDSLRRIADINATLGIALEALDLDGPSLDQSQVGIR